MSEQDKDAAKAADTTKAAKAAAKPAAATAAGATPAATAGKPASQAKGPIRPRTDGPSAELEQRRAERLGRGATDHTFDKRLSLAGVDIDLENYAYRWVNDEPGRIARLQTLEWEIVSDEELKGLEKARIVGLSRDGRAMSSVLMKKWKAWYIEDQERRRDSSRASEEGRMAPAQAGAQEGQPEKYYQKERSSTVATPETPTRAAAAANYEP